MSEINKLSDVLPVFLSELKDRGRSPSTVLAYGSDIEQLFSFTREKGKESPTQIKPVDIEGFRDFLLSQKYTPKSVSRKLNAIKTFFRWLKEKNFVDKDHSRDVSHPKITLTIPQYLLEHEYRALRDHVRSDIRIAAMVELILQTGLRISELAGITLENIKKNRLVVDAYATQPRREIPLNQAAQASIQLYMTTRPKIEGAKHLFVSKNGKPLAVRNIRAAIDRYLNKAGMPHFSVNDLRTTFIVENIRRGVDLVLISQVAGHKRLSTTERYLELAGVKESGKKQLLEIL